MPVRSRSRPSSPAIQARASRTSRRSSPRAGFHDSRIKPALVEREGRLVDERRLEGLPQIAEVLHRLRALADQRVRAALGAARGAPGGARASRGRRRGRAASRRRGPRGWPGGRGRRCPRAPAGDRRGAPAPPPARRPRRAAAPISRGRRSGRRSHWRSRRPPIDVRVRSIAQRSVAVPPRSCRLSTSSRLRAAPSSRVRWSSTARIWMRARCPSGACCVSWR